MLRETTCYYLYYTDSSKPHSIVITLLPFAKANATTSPTMEIFYYLHCYYYYYLQYFSTKPVIYESYNLVLILIFSQIVSISSICFLYVMIMSDLIFIVVLLNVLLFIVLIALVFVRFFSFYSFVIFISVILELIIVMLFIIS